jgi:3-hydroxy-9,10-secoandrosta-1,3,5(10)-triene-9,17-dione monooxygenase reductase component
LLAEQPDTGTSGTRPAGLDPAAAPAVGGNGQNGQGDTGQISVEEFKRAAGSFTTGVTVVTTRDPGGELRGFTANSFTSVSLDPPLVLVCLHRRAPSLHAFQPGHGFAVNVLAEDQEWMSHRFGRASDNKFAGVAYRLGAGGAPLIDGCIAHIECTLETSYDGGDHVILLGRVRNVAASEGSPLIFHRSRYLRALR